MNQLPQYAFELLTDKDLTIGVPIVNTDWFNDGAGTPWVNTSEGAQFIAASGDSTLLRKALPDMPAGAVLDIVVQVKTVNACQINVAYKTSAANPVYYIHRRKLTNSTGFVIARFRFQTYAANPKGIAVSITDATGSSDVVISYIRVAVIDGDRRSVVPGGFKSISLELDRMLELNGITQLINGVITLFGDDLNWLLTRVRSAPSRMVKIGIVITSGDDVLTLNPVILDVLNINIVTDGNSYKANLVMLTDEEWMNFIAYYSEGLDTSKPFDRLGVPTVQAQGSIETVNAPTGKQISLSRRFFGYVGPTETITLQPEQIMRIGFGSDIEVNDGFKTSIGLTSNPTIETEDGQFLNIVGTVKVLYTKSNAQVEVKAVLTTGAAPTQLSSGVIYNINIVQALGTQNSSQYDVIVYNGSGSTQTIKINSGSPNSFLNVTTVVTYALQPQGIQLWQGIKSLFSRILGEYDSVDMRDLEDVNEAGINFSSADMELRNPPLQFIDNLKAQYGSWYIAGTYDWELIGLTIRGASPSNILKFAFIDQSPNGGVLATSYATKSVYTLRIDFDIPNTTLNMFIDIYGFNGIQYELLKTVQFLGSNINTTLDLTARYYDSIGLVSRGGGIVTITVFQVLLNTGTYTRQGEYAMNFIFNGISSRESEPAVDSLCINTSLQNAGGIMGKLFGLAILPIVEVGKRLKFNVAGFDEAYRNDVSTVNLYLQSFTESIDNDLAFDRVKVGGPFRNEEPYDLNASCTESTYASTWASTNVRKDLAFNVCLNTNMIINKELGNDDLYLLNLVTRSLVPSTGNRYRLDDGLTIVGAASPFQVNWIHSESRIMRRNIPLLFSGKPTYFRLIESIEGNQVFVDYPADGFGLISDATLITGVGSFTPFIIEGETALTLEEFKQVQVDKYKLFNLIVDGLPKYQVYIKNVVYNFATGKMLMKVWIKNYL